MAPKSRTTSKTISKGIASRGVKKVSTSQRKKVSKDVDDSVVVSPPIKRKKTGKKPVITPPSYIERKNTRRKKINKDISSSVGGGIPPVKRKKVTLLIPGVDAYEVYHSLIRYVNDGVVGSVEYTSGSDGDEDAEELELFRSSVANDDAHHHLSHQVIANARDNCVTYRSSSGKHINMTLTHTGDDMPDTTDSLCWWCRYKIDGRPIGLPIEFHERKSKTGCYYEVNGFFDNISCVLAYFVEKKDNPLYRQSEGLINSLARDLYGPDVVVVSAPSWKFLRNGGGAMSRNDWVSDRGKCVYTSLNDKRVPAQRRLFGDLVCPHCSGIVVKKDDQFSLVPIGVWYTKTNVKK